MAGRALSTVFRPALKVTAERRVWAGAQRSAFLARTGDFFRVRFCGTLIPVENATLFQSRQRFPSNIDDWVSWGCISHTVKKGHLLILLSRLARDS